MKPRDPSTFGQGAETRLDFAIQAPYEVVHEEIVGWRAWRLGAVPTWVPMMRKVRVLESCVFPFVWKGPVVHADVVPAVENPNGIYAFKQRPHTSERWRDYASGFYPVWGLVALSGMVLLGQRGYRAEVATVRALTVCDASFGGVEGEERIRRVCAELEARYQCDVIRVPTARYFAPFEKPYLEVVE